MKDHISRILEENKDFAEFQNFIALLLEYRFVRRTTTLQNHTKRDLETKIIIEIIEYPFKHIKYRLDYLRFASNRSMIKQDIPQHLKEVARKYSKKEVRSYLRDNIDQRFDESVDESVKLAYRYNVLAFVWKEVWAHTFDQPICDTSDYYGNFANRRRGVREFQPIDENAIKKIIGSNTKFEKYATKTDLSCFGGTGISIIAQEHSLKLNLLDCGMAFQKAQVDERIDTILEQHVRNQESYNITISIIASSQREQKWVPFGVNHALILLVVQNDFIIIDPKSKLSPERLNKQATTTSQPIVYAGMQSAINTDCTRYVGYIIFAYVELILRCGYEYLTIDDLIYGALPEMKNKHHKRDVGNIILPDYV